MNIWRFQRRLTTMLLGWAAASIVVGLAMSRRKDSTARGIGEQFIGWGVINAAIGLVGGWNAERRRRSPDALSAETMSTETRKLGRLLWVNTGLDVLYMLGGGLAAGTRGAADGRWRGRGIGIMIQGGFLFFFDLVNALLLGRLDEVGDFHM